MINARWHVRRGSCAGGRHPADPISVISMSERTPPHPENRHRIPELLAPAGSPGALAAAVGAGADAVYLSGKRFGARHYAANFDEREMRDAVRYAHLHGVRVYVTVNTLVTEDELPAVTEYLISFYEIGVDGVLIQDTGVAATARRVVPGLELHASTQMTIHNREGLEWAADMGFARVVLSREMTLPEITDAPSLCREDSPEIEVFAHGALCYSYSGQCLISSAIGGRSANRGMCAQPCRKYYRLERGGMDRYGRPVSGSTAPQAEGYLLSMRNLALYPCLDLIADTPVRAIKIEGRMKSPEYVATVVSIYRKALDAIASGDWQPDEAVRKNLVLAFNREFTDGYLCGRRHAEVIGATQPGNRGLPLGSVVAYDAGRGRVVIDWNGSLLPEPGDGLLFAEAGEGGSEVGVLLRYPPDRRGNLLSLKIERDVTAGMEVRLTRRRSLLRSAEKTIEGSSRYFRSLIPIDLTLQTEQEMPPLLEGVFSDHRNRRITVAARADFTMMPAINQPLTAARMEEQFRKTGGTPFTIRKMEIRCQEGLFTTTGNLNRLRRAFLTKAEEALIAAYLPSAESVTRARNAFGKLHASDQLQGSRVKRREEDAPTPQVSCYVDSIAGARGALEGGCSHIYFEPFVRSCRTGGEDAQGVPEREQEKVLKMLKEVHALCRESGAVPVWKLPCITRRTLLDQVEEMLPEVCSMGIRDVMAGNMGAAYALKKAGCAGMNLYGSSALNVWNHATVAEVSSCFSHLTISPELASSEAATLIRRSAQVPHAPSLEMLVQGNLEVCITENCILASSGLCPLPDGTMGCRRTGFTGIRDATGRLFPVRIDGGGRTHISNAVELCLIDHLPEILSACPDSVAIDGRGRTGKYCSDMAHLYHEAISLTGRRGGEGGGEELRERLSALKEAVRRRSCGGITGGHFVRGRKEE